MSWFGYPDFDSWAASVWPPTHDFSSITDRRQLHKAMSEVMEAKGRCSCYVHESLRYICDGWAGGCSYQSADGRWVIAAAPVTVLSGPYDDGLGRQKHER